MSRKLDVLVLFGSVQQSLCDKWGDKNIGGHPDDQTTETPGFKPFTVFFLNVFYRHSKY